MNILFLEEAANATLTAGDKVALTIAIGVFFIPVVILTLYVCVKKIVDVAKRNQVANAHIKEEQQKEKEAQRLEIQRQQEEERALKQLERAEKKAAIEEEKRQNQTLLEVFGGKKNIVSKKFEDGKIILELADPKLIDLGILRDRKINIMKTGNIIKSNNPDLIEYFKD